MRCIWIAVFSQLEKITRLYIKTVLEEEEFEWLLNFFGAENVFEITKEEMYDMNSNIFSISETVVISEQNFSRLNSWLESLGIQVERVPYAEIAKQEGLLRCSTLPLIANNYETVYFKYLNDSAS